MSICHGCNSPLEPLAQIRTYHSGCDPQGRVEFLESAITKILELAREGKSDLGMDLPGAAGQRLAEIADAASAALEYRPAQMKGSDG